MGGRIEMSASGGSVDVTWHVASVTIPMSRVELIVNGEVRESLTVPAGEANGHWSVKVDKQSALVLKTANLTTVYSIKLYQSSHPPNGMQDNTRKRMIRCKPRCKN
jgi:hypothetical protein